MKIVINANEFEEMIEAAIQSKYLDLLAKAGITDPVWEISSYDRESKMTIEQRIEPEETKPEEETE